MSLVVSAEEPTQTPARCVVEGEATACRAGLLANEALFCVEPDRTYLTLTEAGEQIATGPLSYVMTFPVELSSYWTRRACEDEAVSVWEDAVHRCGLRCKRVPSVAWSVGGDVLTVSGAVHA